MNRYFGQKKTATSGVEVENLKESAEVTVFEPQSQESDQTARKKLLRSLKSKDPSKQNKGDGATKKAYWAAKRRQERDEEDAKPVPVSEEKLNKYYRDEPANWKSGVKTSFARETLRQREEKYAAAQRFSAKAELMLMEEPGFVQRDKDYEALTQQQMLKEVDLISQQKVFDLKLDKFGPYRVSYTRNGRYLAMAGALGHVACFDWVPKRLMCEVNVRERCRDICWLHHETMFAVAQKRLYIYDNQGIELHCINSMDNVERLEFLPYHFLLVGAHSSGYLSYLDTSVGKMVAQFPTREGSPLNVMCQNPSNAIIHLGHRGGTVTLWSPNVKESLVKILCHTTPVQSVAVDSTGNYMATSAVDRRLSIWDLRNHSQKLATLKLPAGASSLAYSQRGLIAASFNHTVNIYDPKDFLKEEQQQEEDNVQVLNIPPHLRHTVCGQIENVKFVPYEDVLGIGYETGIASILVPGSGEPNFDAYEVNPYMSKKQRREAEVKALLDKIQPELIDLDPSKVLEVHRPSVLEHEQKKRKLLLGNRDQLVVEPRFKVRGLSMEKRKRLVKEELLRKQKKDVIEQARALDEEMKQQRPRKGDSATKKSPATGIDGVLSRFSKFRKA